MLFLFLIQFNCTNIDKQYIDVFKAICRDILKNELDLGSYIKNKKSLDKSLEDADYFYGDDIVENLELKKYLEINQQNIITMGKDLEKINSFEKKFTEYELEEILNEIMIRNSSNMEENTEFCLETLPQEPISDTEIEMPSNSYKNKDCYSCLPAEEIASLKSIKDRIKELKEIGFFKQVRFGRDQERLSEHNDDLDTNKIKYFSYVESKDTNLSRNLEEAICNYEVEEKFDTSNFKNYKEEFKVILISIIENLKLNTRESMKLEQYQNKDFLTGCVSNLPDIFSEMKFYKRTENLVGVEFQKKNFEFADKQKNKSYSHKNCISKTNNIYCRYYIRYPLEYSNLYQVGEIMVVFEVKEKLVSSLKNIINKFNENSKIICDIIRKHLIEFEDHYIFKIENTEKLRYFLNNCCSIFNDKLKDDKFLENLDFECDYPFENFKKENPNDALHEIKSIVAINAPGDSSFIGFLEPHTKKRFEYNHISIFILLRYFKTLLREFD